MQIPETDNIHLQYAFKKGYRLALEGKTINNMPSEFRMDTEKRDWFLQGFDQGKEDLSNSDMYGAPTCWRCRLTWISIMILGGIATAYLIIHKYETEQAELALLKQAQFQQQALTTNSPDSLSLLSEAQRADLTQNIEESPLSNDLLPPLTPVVESTIQFPLAVFTSSIDNGKPGEIYSDVIPKYVREIYFYTQVDFAKGQQIFHRWRFQSQNLATVALKIDSEKSSVWSAKKMSSAWQGLWYLEILNNQQQVIYRTSFNYGAQK